MTVPLEHLVVVFLAGLVTALSTGLGALPFFLTDEVSDRWLVALWGLAAGIILSASLFGLLPEALEVGSPVHVVAGLLVGVGLVVVADRVVGAHDFEPRTLARADFDKLVLIVGVLTIHSVPEGVAVGWAVFSGLPQPVGAVLAYYFVTLASGVLPFGFGLAAGAMIYLVARDMLPEAAARGRRLPGGGRRELLAGLVVGLGSMLPLLVVFG